MAVDEKCRICGEPRSAHVATSKGAFTHPREARGEGHYVRTEGGIMGESWPGRGDALEWDRWEFVPCKEKMA